MQLKCGICRVNPVESLDDWVYIRGFKVYICDSCSDMFLNQEAS